MNDEKLNFRIISSWNNDDAMFSFVFMIEFLTEESILSKTQRALYSGVSKFYKIEKNKFVKYLENYGDEGKDWKISKHRGPYNLGAAMMLGFNDKYNATAFILENG